MKIKSVKVIWEDDSETVVEHKLVPDVQGTGIADLVPEIPVAEPVEPIIEPKNIDIPVEITSPTE